MNKIKVQISDDGMLSIDGKSFEDFSSKEKKDLLSMIIDANNDSDTLISDIIASIAEELGDYDFVADDNEELVDEWFMLNI